MNATGYDLASSLRRQAFSIPAVLAVLCILAALAVAIVGDPLWARAVRRRATVDARAYAGQMHPGLTRVVCQGVDSDGDGYVSCTVGDGAGSAEGVECRATVWRDYDRGCRPMRAMVRAMGGAR